MRAWQCEIAGYMRAWQLEIVFNSMLHESRMAKTAFLGFRRGNECRQPGLKTRGRMLIHVL